MNPDDDSDEETNSGRQSIKRYWKDQFKKEGFNQKAIKPEFDIFSNFIA